MFSVQQQGLRLQQKELCLCDSRHNNTAQASLDPHDTCSDPAAGAQEYKDSTWADIEGRHYAEMEGIHTREDSWEILHALRGKVQLS